MTKKRFQLNRREFAQAGLAGGLLGALARPGLALPGGGNGNKLLLFFLRGAYDSTNAVIPFGDPEYNTTNRPDLYFDPFADPKPLADPGHELLRAQPRHVAHAATRESPRGRVSERRGKSRGERVRTSRINARWRRTVSHCATSAVDPEEGFVARLRHEHFSTGFTTASVSNGLQQMFVTRDSAKKMNGSHQADPSLPNGRPPGLYAQLLRPGASGRGLQADGGAAQPARICGQPEPSSGSNGSRGGSHDARQPRFCRRTGRYLRALGRRQVPLWEGPRRSGTSRSRPTLD